MIIISLLINTLKKEGSSFRRLILYYLGGARTSKLSLINFQTTINQEKI